MLTQEAYDGALQHIARNLDNPAYLAGIINFLATLTGKPFAQIEREARAITKL